MHAFVSGIFSQHSIKIVEGIVGEKEEEKEKAMSRVEYDATHCEVT